MIYVLLPIYNEERGLPILFEKLDKDMQRRESQYHVIAYNDGSKDNSLEVLNKYKKTMPITVIGEKANKGLGVALDSLLKATLDLSVDREDVAVVLDSDDTHNPGHIYQMINMLKNGFDVVIASRYLPDSKIIGVGWSRQLFSIGASWLMRALFPIKGIRDYTSGYRAYTINCLRRAYEKFGEHLIEEKNFVCMPELIIKLRNMNIIAGEIPIILRYDQKYGKSKMKILKTIQRTLLMLYRLKKTEGSLMRKNNDDWFSSNSDSIDIGPDYERKALKGHRYYVKVKSLHLLRKAEELYGDTRNLTCIDLGCGTAETTEYFQNKFSHVFGCDYSRGMLECAAKKNLKNVTFKLCQSERLPFDTDSIDVVLMYGIIHHIDTGEKIMRTFDEVNRILKKGGMVAVYDFNPFNPLSRYIVKTHPIDAGVNLDGYRKSLFPTTFYSWELTAILKSAGFGIAKHEYLLFFPKILSALVSLERFLAKVPLGGMYSIIGIK